MKYIDAEKLKAEIERLYYNEAEKDESILAADAYKNALDAVEKFLDSLQQEQPYVNLANKFGWHNVSEETPEFGDTVIVACKNKNKEDGIWLYDLIRCWEGEWEPRENWETPLMWISVDEYTLTPKNEK